MNQRRIRRSIKTSDLNIVLVTLAYAGREMFLLRQRTAFLFKVLVFVSCIIFIAASDHKKEKDSLLKQAKDTHHIKEHLKEQYGIDDEAAERYLNETSAEAQFFLMHDYDNNSRLDGLELLKGLSDHQHHEEEGDHTPETEMDLVELVDDILEDQDLNNDGYIDYPEFATLSKPQGPTGGGHI